MQWLFWGALLVVAYAYAGYWLLLRLLAGARNVPSQSGGVDRSAPVSLAPPSVSVILTARNEAPTLPAKLRDLRAQTYPHERMECIVVSDGSTDDTVNVVLAVEDVQLIELPAAGGKANALNRAYDRATGDVLVFFDARQRIPPETIEHLLAPFADPGVGAVSGELLLVDAAGKPDHDALGLYWKIEKAVRRLESATGSVVGATGAIYAMRRSLFVPLPPGLILDDVWLPMHAARAGGRVLFQPSAVATDRLFTDNGPKRGRGLGREWTRKVRTLTGNLQLVRSAPWMLTGANPLLFRFLSHKLLRLLVPYLLVLMLVASACSGSSVLHGLFALQLLCWGLAGAGSLWPGLRRLRSVGVPYTFLMLNAAAVVAVYKFFRRQDVWA